jgi:hypothetical protein
VRGSGIGAAPPLAHDLSNLKSSNPDALKSVCVRARARRLAGICGQSIDSTTGVIRFSRGHGLLPSEPASSGTGSELRTQGSDPLTRHKAGPETTENTTVAITDGPVPMPG